MKSKYIKPQLEIVEVELEGAILQGSGTSSNDNKLDDFIDGLGM